MIYKNFIFCVLESKKDLDSASAMPAGPFLDPQFLYRYTSRATCSVLQGLPDPSKPHCYALAPTWSTHGLHSPHVLLASKASSPRQNWNAFKDHVALASRAPSKSTGLQTPESSCAPVVVPFSLDHRPLGSWMTDQWVPWWSGDLQFGEGERHAMNIQSLYGTGNEYCSINKRAAYQMEKLPLFTPHWSCRCCTFKCPCPT